MENYAETRHALIELFPNIAFDAFKLLHITSSTLATTEADDKLMAIALAELIDLAGFNTKDVLNITAIEQGLSQHCFEIKMKQRCIIAKKFSQVTSLTKEVMVLKQLKESGLVPKLLSYSQHIMLMSKLPGKPLSILANCREKFEQLISTMVSFHGYSQHISHQLTLFPPLLLPEILSELYEYANLTVAQKSMLNRFIQPMLKGCEYLLASSTQQQSSITHVLCHGDFNTTNVLISDKNSYLIDFESASIMPIEYDLAMMLAVNELSKNEITEAVELYQHIFDDQSAECFTSNNEINKANQPILTPLLVQYYYFIALSINGLWYLGKYLAEGDVALLNKANKQFSLAGVSL